jgi:hypothetical protein
MGTPEYVETELKASLAGDCIRVIGDEREWFPILDQGGSGGYYYWNPSTSATT